MKLELQEAISKMIPTDDDWCLVDAIQDSNGDYEPEEFVEECEEECDWINFGNELVQSSEYREWVEWREWRAKLAVYERIHGEITQEDWEAQ